MMTDSNSKAMDNAKRQARSAVTATDYQPANIRADGIADQPTTLKQLDTDTASGLARSTAQLSRDGTYANIHKDIDKQK